MTLRMKTAGEAPRWKSLQLHHDPERHLPSPGCAGCVDRPICGKLSTATGLFDCSIHCCNRPDSCRWVCRRNRQFRQQIQEIRGLSLDNVAISLAPRPSHLPDYAPQIFHGSLRQKPVVIPAAALKLTQLFDKRTGAPRFATREALLGHFMIDDGAQIIVTGVDKDASIERWWGIGERPRRQVIDGLVAMGVAIATTPNYSLCLNWPRIGDLAAMKRILLCAAEMMAGGLPTALHVNGRTPHDFARWAETLIRLDAITHLAYEFTTGAAHGERRDQHITWLCELAARVNRPLHLIAFGDSRAVVPLKAAFAGVTWIDTTSFMKTVHRRRAARAGNGKLIWPADLTPPGAHVHGLLAHNVGESRIHHAMRTAT